MESTQTRPNNLKIIADDLGIAESINRGIVLALENGWIDGASIMANGEAFDDAIAKIKSYEVQPSIGIHFVLVEEKSVTGIDLPKNHKIFFIKYVLGLINLTDIEKELKAQLNKCINVGIKLAFINSHQHLHLLPGIADIVIKLAKENNIPHIRIVNEPISLVKGKLFRQAQLLFLNFLSRLVKNKIKKENLKYNDIFIGFINAGNLKKENKDLAQKLAREYPNKIIELGCHPGYGDDNMQKYYKNWGNYNWEKELDLLKDR